MFVLVVLIIISLLLAIGFLVAYLWAVKNNQYDDDYTPSVRILFEDKQDKDKDKSNN
jgi:cbb3-type cytochrome oxidase maturation protein